MRLQAMSKYFISRSMPMKALDHSAWRRYTRGPAAHDTGSQTI
jgi:hypothetical protein